MNGPEERTNRLREAAHRKTLEATRKASAAIDDLLTAREAVTFRGVARRGNVSIDFVYRNAAIRARISELRGAERDTVDTEERARDSTVVHALTLKIRKLREENSDLRHQLAVVHGELLEVRRAAGHRPNPPPQRGASRRASTLHTPSPY
jgi:hypothetical protein